MVGPRTKSNPGRTRLHTLRPKGRLFLETSNFDSWYLLGCLTYRPKIFSIKSSKPFKKVYNKYQETSYKFRLGFALSNRPHLLRAYIVRVLFDLTVAVSIDHCNLNQENLTYPFQLIFKKDFL